MGVWRKWREESRAVIPREARMAIWKNDFCSDSQGGICNHKAGKKRTDSQARDKGLQTARDQGLPWGWKLSTSGDNLKRWDAVVGNSGFCFF